MTRLEGFVVFALALASVAGVVLLPPLLARPYAAPVAWDGSPQFSVDRAWSFVEILATRFPRRWAGGPDRRAAADWIAAKLGGMGLQVGRESFPAALGEREPVILENVWGVTRGIARGDEIVVAIGNYDMAPTSRQAASDTAGHAGTLLELARVIHALPHRRTVVFLFPDGEEWGMLGARRFAQSFPERRRIVAGLSIEDLDVGSFQALAVDGIGQFRGFAPMWLRGLAANAAAKEGWPTREVDPLVEWLQRSVLVSFTDQGPFLGEGIASVQLGGRGDDPALQAAVYHLPGDTMDKMRPASVRAYGRIQERMLRAIDAMRDVPSEPFDYLRLGPDRVVSRATLLLAQVLVFVPLAAAFAFRARRSRLSVPVLVREAVETGSVFLVLLVGLAAVRLAPAVGLIPQYALYPPPPRHPLLVEPRWAAIALVVAVLIAGAIVVARAKRRALFPGDGRAARISAQLLWLLVLGAVGLADNAFGAVTFLLLPSLLWIWIGPARGAAARAGNAALAGAGFLALVALFAQYAVVLGIGGYITWYVFMGLAYGQFTLLRAVLGLATIAIGIRLLVLGSLAREETRRPAVARRLAS